MLLLLLLHAPCSALLSVSRSTTSSHPNLQKVVPVCQNFERFDLVADAAAAAGVVVVVVAVDTVAAAVVVVVPHDVVAVEGVPSCPKSHCGLHHHQTTEQEARWR